MSQKFSVKLRSGADYTFVKVKGVIDEDNQLAALGRKLQGKVAVLDLAEVERINSCGVRDWVNWLGEVEGQREVVMVRCSPAIITQANMVTNFTGGALISSFYAPYYCSRCDTSADKLLTVESFAGQASPKAPAFRCEECGQALEFDDFEDTYFAFLASVPQERIDARIKALLEEVAPDLERKIQALNEGNLHTLTGGSLHTATLTPPADASTPSGTFKGLLTRPADVERAAAPPAAPPKAAQPAEAPRSSRGGAFTWALVGVAALVVVVLLVLVLLLD